MKRISLIVFLFLYIASVFALSGSVSPTRININSGIGELIEKQLIIRNTNNISVDVDISYTGNLTLNLSERKFSLNPLEEKIIKFTTKATNPGIKEGRIKVRFLPSAGGNGISISTIVNLNVNSDPNIEVKSLILSGPVEGQEFIIDTEVYNKGSFSENFSISIIDYEEFLELIEIEPLILELGSNEKGNSQIRVRALNEIGEKEFSVVVSYQNKSVIEKLNINILEFSNLSGNFELRISGIEIWKLSINPVINNLVIGLIALENRILEIESRVERLEGDLDLPDYIKFMSSSDKKNILCGYGEERHLTNINRFGLNCEISYKIVNGKEKAQCRCRNV